MYGIAAGPGLAGKAMLVTGGASGMGRSTALLLADAGADVLIGDVNEAGMAETVRLADALPGRVVAHRADVGIDADLIALVDATVAAFGRLDGAANIAGYSPQDSVRRLDAIDRDLFRRSTDINLAGGFFGMQHQIRRMLAQGGGGAIVNVSSTTALRGYPGFSVYTAAKAGIIGLTRTVAQEFGREGIRVNAVVPGPIDTPMLRASLDANPAAEAGMLAASLLGRLGHPDEIGYAVRWLLSDEASFVTGIALTVDGGQTSG